MSSKLRKLKLAQAKQAMSGSLRRNREWTGSTQSFSRATSSSEAERKKINRSVKKRLSKRSEIRAKNKRIAQGRDPETGRKYQDASSSDMFEFVRGPHKGKVATIVKHHEFRGGKYADVFVDGRVVKFVSMIDLKRLF